MIINERVRTAAIVSFVLGFLFVFGTPVLLYGFPNEDITDNGITIFDDERLLSVACTNGRTPIIFAKDEVQFVKLLDSGVIFIQFKTGNTLTMQNIRCAVTQTEKKETEDEEFSS